MQKNLYLFQSNKNHIAKTEIQEAFESKFDKIYISECFFKLSEPLNQSQNNSTALTATIDESDSAIKLLKPKPTNSLSGLKSKDCPSFYPSNMNSFSFETEKLDTSKRSSFFESKKTPYHFQSQHEISLSTSNEDDDSYSRNSTISYRPSRYSQKKVALNSSQQYRIIELEGSLKMGLFIQKELIKNAENGDVLTLKQEFIEKMGQSFYSKFKKNLSPIIEVAEEAKLIHYSIRKYLENDSLIYLGLVLDELTIESLSWVIKSIKNDLMTPTEKLILSRVKECYCLKMDQTKWKEVLDYILSHQSENTKKWNTSNENIFPLKAEKVLDPATQVETFVIFIKGDEWVPEDQGYVDQYSNEWTDFIEFMNDFFSDDNINQQPHKIEPGYFGSNLASAQLHIKPKEIIVPTPEMKAIPGGRYGCAQFLKSCGPESLQRLSIGRLTLLVQEAINKGHLKYEKTLLVKNNPNAGILIALNEGSYVNTILDPVLAKKAKLVRRIKDIILGIISESQEGVSLAQIPLLLRRKLGFSVNFQELGFPKLKNFIMTAMSDQVKIESSGANHSFAVLREPAKKPKFETKPFHKQFPGVAATLLKPTEVKSAEIQSANRPTNYIDEYLRKVKANLEAILRSNRFGVSIVKLQNELSAKLGTEFNSRAFNCKNFYEFLLNYADDLVDIEIKKDMIIVYCKNFRFSTPTQVENPRFDFNKGSKTDFYTFNREENSRPPGLNLNFNQTQQQKHVSNPIPFFQ